IPCGTAIGQGLVAGIGFWIADVPGLLVLSFAVCVLSVIPIGPPLIWGPAAIWLYTQGELGMAVFLVLWGTLAVSSVDNFIKPILISRGTSMPIALIFLGVFGGVLAFGFLGLILGPLLLAIGLALFTAWLKRPVIRLAEAAVSRTDKEAQTAVGTTEASDTKIQ
ncbi:MAG: AI-2E family transporter, partial [Sutterella wadsworthensis]|nr:AI-2E family transporter [Sutterella wadsworthensis]